MKMNVRKTTCLLANGRLRRCFLPAILLALLVLSNAARADKSPYDWALVRLDYARKEKVQQLRHFCERVHNLAAHAGEDDRRRCIAAGMNEYISKPLRPDLLVETIARLAVK